MGEPSAAESETPWSGSGDGELELADESGRTLHDHLAWQLELAHLPPDALASAAPSSTRSTTTAT